jgi:plasmid stabilization system protein ParE
MRSTIIRASTGRWRARRSKRGSLPSRRAFSNSRTAPEVAERPGVRVAAFVDFPYRLFYRVNEETIEVLAIRHTSRRPLYE